MGAALVPRELTGRLRLWAEVPLVCVCGAGGVGHNTFKGHSRSGLWRALSGRWGGAPRK